VAGYWRWLFNKKAVARPGAGEYVSLGLGAAGILPGVMMLLQGPVFWGLLLSTMSLGLIAAGTLPGWRRQQEIAAKDVSNLDSDKSIDSTVKAEPDPIFAPQLRASLKSADQNRALAQLNQLKQKMDDFQAVLALRFEPQELTTHRYQSAGQSVFDGAMRNLETIAAYGHGVRKIDEAALLAQLNELLSEQQGDSKGAIAIRERLNVAAEGNRHIALLLDLNEEAMTSLTRVTTKLASISTKSADTSTSGDMTLLIKDLDELAERTERYASRLDKPAMIIGSQR